MDNLLLSFQHQSGEYLRHIFFFPGKINRQEKRNYEKSLEFLQYLSIEEKKNSLAEDLSYGQQKMVSLACCLASEARLLLLDEPVAGINPETIDNILMFLKKIPEQGKAVVLIEHNIEAVMQVCDKVVFMDQGKKIAEGDPESVRNNPSVIKTYLG